MIKNKKIFIVLLSCILFVFMSIPVFAANSGSIAVNNAVSGQKYSIYRLLDLESYNASTGTYAYKVSAKWASFFAPANNTGALNYVTVDSQGYVTWKADKNTPADYAAFAKIANDYAKSNSIAHDGSSVASGSSLSFNNLVLGYYLADTTMGTLCSLNTTNPVAVITEKNIAPVVTKTVKEGTAYSAKNDASVGDTVYFRGTIIAQAGADQYIFHDKMSSGLLWSGAVSVTKNGITVAASNYSVRRATTTPPACSSCTFDVVFSQNFCNTLAANDEIVISYSAKVLPDAVIGGAGNVNTSWLSYGDSNSTAKISTTTYVWGINVFKFAEKTVEGNRTEIGLAGAKFKLMRGEMTVNLVKDNNTPNLYKVCTDASCSDGHTHVTEITTDSTGRFRIEGMDSGIYYLVETAAPAGYNVLAAPITVTISNTGAVNATQENPTGVGEVKILNQTGPILPVTGGKGVKAYYIVGGLIILCAAGILVFQKKRKR